MLALDEKIVKKGLSQEKLDKIEGYIWIGD
jgi:hypothetical protein